MNIWLNRSRLAWEALLNRPGGSPLETAIVALAACLTFALILNGLTRLMSFHYLGLWRSILATVAAVLVVPLAGAAALEYLAPLPWIQRWGLVDWLPFLAAPAALVLVVTPVLMATHRGRFGPSVTAVLMAAASFAVAVALANSLLGAIESGDRDFGVTRERTRTMNRFLDENRRSPSR